MLFSCLLIGENNLLIECGKHLIDRHHQILGVVSSIKNIQSWCKKNNIPCYNSFTDIPLRENSVDYLFSIVNGIILTTLELKIARYGAFNYHDSILPKYAGVNATTWSLMDFQKDHGITWHKINEKIDEGDIVYQTHFPITFNETALTLNLRCFDEAIKGFEKIIKKIESSTLTQQKQTKENRSYYSLNHVLPNLGFIHWQNEKADSLEIKSRSLNFGEYPNKVGTLKLYLIHSFLIVSDIEIAEPLTLEHSQPSQSGGIILAIKDDALLISTITLPILIKKFYCPNGKILTIKEVEEQFNLFPGYQFPLIKNDLIDQGYHLYKQALSHEKYWLNALSNILDHSIYSDRILSDTFQSIEMNLLEFKNHHDNKNSHLILSSVLLYLIRINNYEPFTIFINSLIPENDCASLFSSYLPINIQAKSTLLVKEFLSEVLYILEAANDQKHYLKDIFFRHRSLSSSNKDPLITINLQPNESTEISTSAKNSLLHFEIDQPKNILKVYHRIDMHCQAGTFGSLVNNMFPHIQNILKHLSQNNEKPIHQFCILSEEERNNIMSWSIGPTLPLPSNTIISLFERIVHIFPKRIAVYHNNNELTYKDLWQKVLEISTLLNNYQLPAQLLIGVRTNNLIDMLITCLGILKANFVCVPLSNDINNLNEFEKIINLQFKKPFYEFNQLLTMNINDTMIIDYKNNQKNDISQPETNDIAGLIFDHNNSTLENSSKQFQMITHYQMINGYFSFLRNEQYNSSDTLNLTTLKTHHLLCSPALAPLLIGGSLLI